MIGPSALARLPNRPASRRSPATTRSTRMTDHHLAVSLGQASHLGWHYGRERRVRTAESKKYTGRSIGYVRGDTLLPGGPPLDRRGGPAGTERLRSPRQGHAGVRLVLHPDSQRE